MSCRRIDEPDKALARRAGRAPSPVSARVIRASVGAVKTGDRRLALPAGALLAAQLVHGAAPGPHEAGSSPVGPVVGLVLLLSAAVAIVGAAWGMRWTRPLLRYTGWAVAVGFLLYHAVPVTSALTFSYWGRADVGPVQWLPVFAAIAAGAWAIVAARPRGRVPQRSAPR